MVGWVKGKWQFLRCLPFSIQAHLLFFLGKENVAQLLNDGIFRGKPPCLPKKLFGATTGGLPLHDHRLYVQHQKINHKGTESTKGGLFHYFWVTQKPGFFNSTFIHSPDSNGSFPKWYKCQWDSIRHKEVSINSPNLIQEKH